MTHVFTILFAVVTLALSAQSAWAGTSNTRANVQELSITKYVDKPTPNLMNACLVGKHLDRATLVVR